MTSPTIRVLVVDDSRVTLRLVSDALRSDPEIEVVGTAFDGLEALKKIEDLRPDVVTLDLEMPVLNGLETLTKLRERDSRIPVVIFSSFSQRGAMMTLEALSLGANDYVAKPHGGGTGSVMERVREELVMKVKCLAGFCPPPSIRGLSPRETAWDDSVHAVEVVAMGASTGGPTALEFILPQLPKTFDAPVVLVQHMPASFTSVFAQRLDAKCAMRVVEAQGGEVLEAGTVYLAAGGRHLEVVRKRGALVTAASFAEPVHSCRPSVDVLFKSVASAAPQRALAVVLTGMGRDGRDGSRLIREAGSEVIVQDKASSVVWGMPGAVAMAGFADEVLPLERLPGAILRRFAEKGPQR